MLTSKKRAYDLAREYLGASHPGRDHLMLLVRRELDQSAAVSVELVRHLRPYLNAYIKEDHRASGISVALLAVVDEFLRAHGVEDD